MIRNFENDIKNKIKKYFILYQRGAVINGTTAIPIKNTQPGLRMISTD